jgi:PIN domain nuclease of toxin-antitoxin system
MKLLLDTHIFIWYILDSQRLNPTIRLLIDDEDNELLLSIASIWEMVIKHSSGKLSLGMPFDLFIEQQLSVNTIELLKINLEHINVVASLPFHHRDPFERILIAQAIVEQISILSADSVFDNYPIERLF